MDDQGVDTAYWEEQETRSLPMPDGTVRILALSRCHWAAYDDLLERYDYTPEKLVEMSLHDAPLVGIAFDEMFADLIAHLDNEFAKIAEKYSN